MGSAEQGARGHPRFLDRQDPRDHPWRNRWRQRNNDMAWRNNADCQSVGVAPGLPNRHRYLWLAVGRAGLGADQGACVQPLALLGDDCRLDNRGNGARGLRRPLARHRLHRRLDVVAGLPRCRAWPLVLVSSRNPIRILLVRLQRLR